VWCYKVVRIVDGCPLGVAYDTLAEIEDRVENSKKEQ
jgi:hypothetical protein